jgi:hypothetical protein
MSEQKEMAGSDWRKPTARRMTVDAGCSFCSEIAAQDGREGSAPGTTKETGGLLEISPKTSSFLVQGLSSDGAGSIPAASAGFVATATVTKRPNSRPNCRALRRAVRYYRGVLAELALAHKMGAGHSMVGLTSGHRGSSCPRYLARKLRSKAKLAELWPLMQSFPIERSGFWIHGPQGNVGYAETEEEADETISALMHAAFGARYWRVPA